MLVFILLSNCYHIAHVYSLALTVLEPAVALQVCEQTHILLYTNFTVVDLR